MPKKTKKEEEIVESEPISKIADDSDSSDGEEIDSDNESVEGSVDDQQLDESDDKQEETKKSKEEKETETFDTVFEDLSKVRTDTIKKEQEKITLIKEHEVKLKELNDALKKFKSTEKKLMEKIPKLHKTEVTKASKEKRKRNKENKGGFNKEAPVPEKLREFLDLEEDVLLSRPSVMSKLNDKFKELGLKDGQKTILDKKTAKKFGLKNGHIIPFEGMQTFLKEQYVQSTNSTSV